MELGLLGVGHPAFDAQTGIEQADIRKSCVAQHCHLFLWGQDCQPAAYCLTGTLSMGGVCSIRQAKGDMAGYP